MFCYFDVQNLYILQTVSYMFCATFVVNGLFFSVAVTCLAPIWWFAGFSQKARESSLGFLLKSWPCDAWELVSTSSFDVEINSGMHFRKSNKDDLTRHAGKHNMSSFNLESRIINLKNMDTHLVCEENATATLKASFRLIHCTYVLWMQRMKNELHSMCSARERIPDLWEDP